PRPHFSAGASRWLLSWARAASRSTWSPPGFVEDTEFFGDRLTQERRQRLIGQTLVGRAGRPDDVAAAVLYLASPDASFVTAQMLQVNGGALLGRRKQEFSQPPAGSPGLSAPDAGCPPLRPLHPPHRGAAPQYFV